MYKIIEPGGWDKLESQGLVHILPFRQSGGISENDRRSFFRKTAASERFLHDLDRFKLADGDIPVHVNAIGASELYGPNRKGDAFSEQVCRDRHGTFVSEGRNYVHHRNRDPKNSFGKIAASCYNDAMHRIELLVVSNGNESAARRNGGRVVPSEFLSQLEKNAAVPVSMGCTIDHDVCSICGNHARTRAEYCDETNCCDTKTGEYFPGCRNGLMKIASDGRMQFVYNIKPTFFDLSYVGVPADRTGYGFRADYLPHSFGKAASLDTARTAEQYLGLPASGDGPLPYRREMTLMLGKLAAFEERVRHSAGDRVQVYGLRAAGQDPGLGLKLAAMPSATRTAALGLLAREGVLLSPENFALAFSLGKTAGDDIRAASGSIYSETLGRYGRCRPETPARVLAALDPNGYQKLAEMRLPLSLLRASRITPDRVTESVTAGTIRFKDFLRKNAAAGAMFRDLAESYALCNAASLCRFPLDLQGFGVKLAVWHTV